MPWTLGLKCCAQTRGFPPAAPLLSSLRNSQFLIYTSGSIEGRIFNFAASSANNTLSMGNNAAAGEWALATQADAPGTFNGGSPAVEQVGAARAAAPGRSAELSHGREACPSLHLWP
jgi:hypothetical protein